MLTFSQFLEKLFESKHGLQPGEDPLKVINAPAQGFARRIFALRHLTKDKGYEPSHYVPHIQRMKNGNQWEMIGAIAHPHSHEVFDDADHERLKNHPNKKVRDAYAKRFGGGSAAVAKPAEPKPAEPKQPKPKAVKIPKPKIETPKAEEPKEKKPAGSFSVEKGDTDDFAYSTDVTHVKDHKGRKVGSVVSLRIPSEFGQDRVHHVAYAGNHEKGNLRELGSHENHLDAIKALGKHLKNN